MSDISLYTVFIYCYYWITCNIRWSYTRMWTYISRTFRWSCLPLLSTKQNRHIVLWYRCLYTIIICTLYLYGGIIKVPWILTILYTKYTNMVFLDTYIILYLIIVFIVMHVYESRGGSLNNMYMSFAGYNVSADATVTLSI